MDIPVASCSKVKRRNSLGKVYYKMIWVWNSEVLKVIRK